MIKKTSTKFGFDASFLFSHIVWYFLSVFFFSRLFYVISHWESLKFIQNPLEFFLMSDYNFSLFGAIFGFVFFLYFHTKSQKKRIEEFIDGAVLAFFAAATVGYIGALFGGQVYGTETSLGIEIAYNHAFTPVPYKVPIFPLPIFYSLITFILFSIFYTSHIFTNKRGYIGYLGLISFSVCVIIFDSLNGRYDTLGSLIGIHFSQLFAFACIIACIMRMKKLVQQISADEAVQK